MRQFAVTVVDGADRGARVVSAADELAIGTAEGNDLRLTDPAVSRHHCALRVIERGLELRDLGSRNGTFIGDVELSVAYLRTGAQLPVGQSVLAVEVLDNDVGADLLGQRKPDRFRELGGA